MNLKAEETMRSWSLLRRKKLFTSMGFTQEKISAMVAQLELDGSKVSMVVPCNTFVNGQCVKPSASADKFSSCNPATGQVVVEIASCAAQDIDIAVQAARAAFDSGCWSDLALSEHKIILIKFANLIEEPLLELAVMDTIEVGKPVPIDETWI